MRDRKSFVRWHCPSCRVELPRFDPGRVWQCMHCRTQHCMVGLTPLLVQNSSAYLESTISELSQYCDEQAARLKRVQATLNETRHGWRAPMLAKAQQALRQHLQLARAQIGKLQQAAASQLATPCSPPVHNGPGTWKTPDYGLQNLIYLRVDWAGTPEGERQIETVERVLLKQIEQYCDPQGSATALGAATGRYAFDLANRFAQLIAVELCYSYVDLFERLQEGAFSFYELTQGVSNTPGTLAVKHLAALPKPRDALDKLAYVIADARALPLPDSSQSAVLSIYFADVVPLPELLPEVVRVLEPGGHFINFGPLHYHFQDLSWMLTPEEVRQYVTQWGLRFEEEQWIEMPFCSSPHDCGYVVHRVWSYVLTKQ